MTQDFPVDDYVKFDIFPVEIGKRIRQARIDANLNQTELADMLHKKQTSISEIERGKIEISASTLLHIAIVLKKPITYFFPAWSHKFLQPEKLTHYEAELLSSTRKISEDDMKRIIIQVRALASYAERQYHEWLDDQEEPSIDPDNVS